MRYSSTLIISFVILTILFLLPACSRDEESDRGVAKVDASSEIGIEVKADSQSDRMPINKRTDEEVVTDFTQCMRDEGFDIPDPELNADGTVNLENLKENFDRDAGFNLQQKRSEKALDTCVPILADATFAGKSDKEDPIETQDKMLAFARCLRDQGLNVPDPDFSGNARTKMKPLVQDLAGSASQSRIDAAVNLCSDFVWSGVGGSTSGKK
jgi:hypothetical protein